MRGGDRKQENWSTQETLEEMRPSLKNKAEEAHIQHKTNYIVSFRPPRLYSKTLSKTKQGRQRTNSQKLISTHMYSFLKTPPNTVCMYVHTWTRAKVKVFCSTVLTFFPSGTGTLTDLKLTNSARWAGKLAPESPIFAFHQFSKTSRQVSSRIPYLYFSQAQAAAPDFHWLLGNKLRNSNLLSKHFINWVIASSPKNTLFSDSLTHYVA